MSRQQLEAFLARVRGDTVLQQRLQAAITADEVARLAQSLGYEVSGGDLLRLSGRSVSGVRVQWIDHPGEYPGRYL